ncbi:MAG: iron-siderophore ABC transporter substrate-binding protein [Timaviella obliquedivisa GSE-PSE-MK23-08B]|jgi:iron complex transport system substrate-binding protein|nr:iron-siderophore ABC transporter substrate-binding protein [Timaviella obliquedivisa GSE-PSE-MK23-08B]
MRFIPRFLRFLTLMILAIGIATACASAPNQVSSPQSKDCYRVTHVMGKTCIPKQPQRVVVLDTTTFEFAIALGIKPIGATLSDEFASQVQQDLIGIEDIGNVGEPSLEKILALQPDLIIGQDYHQTIYSQSSQIAPTILYGFEHSGQWKDVFMDVARILQKTEIAKQVMNDYDKRLDQFRQKMGERLKQTEVSVVRIYPDSVNLYLKESFCGTILQDAGLLRPEAQNISASEAKKRFDNEIQVSISRELLHQADGDVMFIWTGENTAEANQQAQQKLAELKSDPLWQGLRAVKQNKIYQVPSYWIGSGTTAANLVIDDLFKYLVETPL